MTRLFHGLSSHSCHGLRLSGWVGLPPISVLPRPRTPTSTLRRVATVTSDFRGAGTDSDVMMTLIGAKGDSGARLLESPTGKDVFERGQTDHFEVECGDLGEITAVKIANKGKGMFSAWHLARVEVTHLESGREYVFLCNEWLDKEHGLERTLLPSTKDGEAAREVWEEGTYEVRVFTSDIRGAGTDGDVSISIKGEDGFIGLQELPAKRQAFEKARADTFTLKGTRCGRLTEVEVALEPRGMASAWHLSRVEIIDRSDGRTYVFPCDQWLDGDHKRVTLLEGALAARKAEEAGVKAERKYVVRVWTGNRSGAGTDDKVFVEVKDSAGKLLGGRALQLDNSRNNFEQGQEDTFELAFPEEEAIGEKIEFLAVEKKAAVSFPCVTC